jgi:hypothetical protein
MKQNSQLRVELARKLFDYIPHSGGQMEWMLDENKRKCLATGRQFGKSQSAGIDLATYALLKPGSRQCIVAPKYDQGLIIFDYVLRTIKSCKVPLGVKMTVSRTAPAEMWFGPKGTSSQITTMSADQVGDGAKQRGWQFDRIIVDEAAFCVGPIIHKVFVPMLARVDGVLMLQSTPNGENWFWGECQKTWKESGITHHHSSYDNPYLPRSFLDEQKRLLGETSLAWRQEYMAEFVASASAYFHIPHVERAMEHGRVLPQVVQSGHKYVAGVDFAEISDWTVVCVVDVTKSVWEVVALDRFHRVQDQKWDWTEQIKRVASCLEYWNAEALVDSTQMGSPLRDMLSKLWPKTYGFNMAHYRQGHILCEGLQLKFDRNELLLPSEGCEEGRLMLDEFRSFQVKQSVQGYAPHLGAAKGHHDDIVFALGLACKMGEGSADVYNQDEKTYTLSDSVALMRSRQYNLDENSQETPFFIGKNW